MTKSHWRLLVVVFGLAGFAHSEDIAAAATSPHRLAMFVETHANFDWLPLWRALNIRDQSIFLPACEQSFEGVPPCSSEFITVVDPLQLIVLLEDRSSHFEVFLQYRSAGPDAWRFTGAYAPFVKYFRPEHRVTRFGAKPFLVVTGQGYSGTGVSSKVESWIDLTRQDFDRVFAFTAEGHHQPFLDGIGRRMGGSVVTMTANPVERITVAFHVEFRAIQNGDDSTVIGERRDRVVYARTSNGQFEVDQGLSSATADELKLFYEDLGENEWGDREFLKFNWNGFKSVATGTDNKARSWMSRFLEHCPDSRESRELRKLLALSR